MRIIGYIILFSLLPFLVSCDKNDTPLTTSRYTLSFLSDKIIYDNDLLLKGLMVIFEKNK